MSNPARSILISPPMMRVSWMLPTVSYPGSSQSTQCSCTVTTLRPRCLATPVTARVWFDWVPPMETSVSQPRAIASAARYSSLRTLLPPKAMPELQSSRLAQISTSPPSAALSHARLYAPPGVEEAEQLGAAALVEAFAGLGQKSSAGTYCSRSSATKRHQTRQPQDRPAESPSRAGAPRGLPPVSWRAADS